MYPVYYPRPVVFIFLKGNFYHMHVIIIIKPETFLDVRINKMHC
jgi:hypothetical protein